MIFLGNLKYPGDLYYESLDENLIYLADIRDLTPLDFGSLVCPDETGDKTMINRNKTKHARLENDRTRSEAATVQSTTADTKNYRYNTSDDDVIGSLANAYENKRARQVNEWEHLYERPLYS